MQLEIRSNDVTYDLFKEFIEQWLQKRGGSTSLSIIPRFEARLAITQELLSRMTKLVGLVITDGPISRILRRKHLKSITFDGLSLDTLYAVFYSGLRLSKSIKISISKQNTLRVGKPYFRITLYLHNDLHRKVLQLIHSLLTESTSISALPKNSKAALFAGLIDGDGYIGKAGKHIAITYKKECLKGEFIDRFLKYLASQDLISLGKYRGKPHYERYVRLIDLEFAKHTRSYVYHPKRSKELEDLIRRLTRNYKCRYSVSEIKAQIRKAISAYIDFRRKEKGRRVPVLVIYVRSEDGRRTCIKLSAKCLGELEACVNDLEIESGINKNILNVVNHYLQLLKSL